ncbi:hypothetical protein AgCh_038738 [Apium graveolens]
MDALLVKSFKKMVYKNFKKGTRFYRKGSSSLNYGLGYLARSKSDKKSGKETEITELIKTDSKVKLNKVQIKTIKFNPSANSVKSIYEEGTTSAPRSNLITEKSEQVHINSVNIGSMTQK